jgi:hypothetical protein
VAFKGLAIIRPVTKRPRPIKDFGLIDLICGSGPLGKQEVRVTKQGYRHVDKQGY